MNGQATGNVCAQTGSGGPIHATGELPVQTSRSCIRIPVRMEGPTKPYSVRVRRGRIGKALAAAPRLIARKFRVLTAGWRRAGSTLAGSLVVIAMTAALVLLLLALP